MRIQALSLMSPELARALDGIIDVMKKKEGKIREKRQLLLEKDSNDDFEVHRCTTITGRKGDVIGKLDSGMIVLFSTPPSRSGETVYLTRYDQRTSKNTGKDYLKCFEYITEGKYLRIKKELDGKKENVDALYNKIRTLSSHRYFISNFIEKNRIESVLVSEFNLNKNEVMKIVMNKMALDAFVTAFDFRYKKKEEDMIEIEKEICGGRILEIRWIDPPYEMPEISFKIKEDEKI